MKGTEAMSVGGTSYESYHTRVAVNVTSGTLPIDSPGDAWFRTSDLSLVKLVLTTTVMTPFGQPSTAVTTVTMNPPQRMQWPLSAGATWTVTGVATVVLEITGQPPHTTAQTVSGTATVGAAESRTVTAGRFDTNPVTLTTSDGNTSKSYWSREAGNYVEQNSHDSSNRDTGSSQLTSYSYTAPSTLGGAGTIGTSGLPSRGTGLPSRRGRCQAPCSRRVREGPSACSSRASSPCRCPPHSRPLPGGG